MSQTRSDVGLRRSNHDAQRSDYPGMIMRDATSHTEGQHHFGWRERRQVFHSNLTKGDWKLAATIYLLLLIIIAIQLA